MSDLSLRVGDPVPSETFEQVLLDSGRLRRERNDWMREAAQLKARVAELEAELAKLRPGGAEPVMAPTAMDATADRWLTYASELETKLGSMRARVDLLTAALSDATGGLEYMRSYVPDSFFRNWQGDAYIGRARTVLNEGEAS